MVLQEVIPVMNFYVPNNIVSKMYKTKILEIQRETDRATVVLEDVNTLLFEINQTDKIKYIRNLYSIVTSYIELCMQQRLHIVLKHMWK